jgi:long-chain acyl-CoA synthetase
VAGVEIELRDKNAQGVGEVYARGRTVMAGYLDAPELTKEALVDGWLRTGDLGTIDAAGHLRLYGRAKNMIVTEGGKNVYPEDVESVFERVECEELCVFAASYLRPAGKPLAEQLTLVVRPNKQGSLTTLLAQIADANRRLADYKRVALYVLWEQEFPRTASMKVKRDRLAEQIRSSSAEVQPLRLA